MLFKLDLKKKAIKTIENSAKVVSVSHATLNPVKAFMGPSLPNIIRHTVASPIVESTVGEKNRNRKKFRPLKSALSNHAITKESTQINGLKYRVYLTVTPTALKKF